MSRYCLDTSAYSHFRKGDETVARLLDESEWVGVPTVVLGELRAGFLRGSRNRENLRQLEEFLAHPLVDELVVDSLVAEHYALLWDELRRQGTPLPTNDVWIAACAARFGATVLTYDDHFACIRRVGSLILDPEGEEGPR